MESRWDVFGALGQLLLVGCTGSHRVPGPSTREPSGAASRTIPYRAAVRRELVRDLAVPLVALAMTALFGGCRDCDIDEDAGCTASPHGRCVRRASRTDHIRGESVYFAAHNECVYDECTRDTDCRQGEHAETPERAC